MATYYWVGTQGGTITVTGASMVVQGQGTNLLANPTNIQGSGWNLGTTPGTGVATTASASTISVTGVGALSLFQTVAVTASTNYTVSITVAGTAGFVVNSELNVYTTGWTAIAASTNVVLSPTGQVLTFTFNSGSNTAILLSLDQRVYPGGGTWNSNTANWSSTSGGSGGAGVPGASDTAIFDANSDPGVGQAATTITTSGNLSVGSITATAYGDTLALGSSTITVTGNIAFGSSMTLSAGTSTITYSGSSTAMTLATGGQSLYALTINASGGKVTLGSALSCNSTVSVMAGTFNTNSYSLTAPQLSTAFGSAVTTLNLGSSTVTLTGGGAAWNFGYNANFTWTNNGSGATVIITASNASFGTGGVSGTINLVSLTMNGGNCQVAGIFAGPVTMAGAGANTVAGTFTTLSITGTSSGTDAVVLNGNVTVSGTLTITGNSVTKRLLIESNTVGTTRTLTCNGTVAFSNVDFQDIAAAGTANWNLSAITGNSGNCGGNSGITFTSGTSQYWYSSGSGNWSDSTKWFLAAGGTGGSGRVPLPQDYVYFTPASFTASGATITIDVLRIPNIDASAITSAKAFNLTLAIGISVYGSFLTSSYVTLLYSNQTVVFAGRSSYNITVQSSWFPGTSATIVAPNGTYTLGSALAVSNFTLTAGTFNAASYSMSASEFEFNSSYTRSLQLGSGTWTSTQTWGTGWDMPAPGGSFTFNGGTATIVFSGTGTHYSNFNGGGQTYYALHIVGGGCPVGISGANTFTSGITIGANQAVNFAAGVTQTVGSFSAVGSSGNLITITSSSSGTQATLSCASGTISCNYLSLQDIKATGGASWYVGANSTNVSDNTGWLWQNPANNYTQTFSATVSTCTGGILRLISTHQSATTATLTGSATKATAKNQTATASQLTGSTTKQTGKIQSATAATVTGSTTKQTTKKQSAQTASFTGTTQKQTAAHQSATASTITAGLSKGVISMIAATMSATTGGLKKLTSHLANAEASQAQAGITKQIGTGLAASMSGFIGSIAKGVSTRLSAVMSAFTGLFSWRKPYVFHYPPVSRIFTAQARQSVFVVNPPSRTYSVSPQTRTFEVEP